MKILFIGGLFPHDRRDEFISRSKGRIQFAADTFQWAFVNGLDAYYNDVTIYSAPFLGNYHKTYKDIIVRGSEFSHNIYSKDHCLGSLRIPILGLALTSFIIYRRLMKMENSNNPYILVYSLHTPYLLAAVRFKRKYPNSKICLIVPDLPQYMSDNKKIIFSFLKKIDMTIQNKLIESVDSFVFVTDLMATRFKLGSRPWTRIEGMYKNESIPEIKVDNDSSEMILLYAGLLDSRYGLLDLIEAFKSIPYANYRLWLCGNGDLKDEIIKYAAIDRRVKYYGQVSHIEVVCLQQKATVLVNPRTSAGEYTKYSFPIKTMEYLASGKPCIMHHLPGIPNEYIEHLFIPQKENFACLRDKIIEVCTTDENIIKEKCRKAKLFILNEKNPTKQVLKIHNLFSMH